jgi:lipopolysaccharide/colanic/teichoic acid biosynthesis glycosyltransferase
MLIKRIFDLFVSIVGLLFLSPFFFAIAVLIKCDSKGHVFFRQERVGQYGTLFKIFKFRTMTASDNLNLIQITVGNDPRITRVGYFLRKYKIDELPQLIDVFLGRMSLVGPRPEMPLFVKRYPHNLKSIVLSVKPGITDNASIEFKAESEILARSINPEREYIEKIIPIKLDFSLKYVANRSFFGDIIIILKTIKVLTH